MKHFSTIYSDNRVRSKFDGRKMLVDVPQRCTHPPTNPPFGSQVKKRVAPKRVTGPHRCVYTNPPKPTKSYSGPRASKEDKRNTHTHLRGPEKLVRTYI